MATTTIVLAFASLLLASLACHGVYAQSLAPEAAGAPSPTTDDGCFTALTNMSDCLTFVQDGSKLSKPDKGCCPELAGLVDSNPICLCQLLGNPDSIGIKINVNKALELPSLCHVSTPPVSTCAVVGVPVSLPPSMSGDSNSISPNMAMPMAPKGSAPTPSSSNAAADHSSGSPSPSSNKNGASSIEASTLTYIFALSTLTISIFF